MHEAHKRPTPSGGVSLITNGHEGQEQDGHRREILRGDSRVDVLHTRTNYECDRHNGLAWDRRGSPGYQGSEHAVEAGNWYVPPF